MPHPTAGASIIDTASVPATPASNLLVRPALRSYGPGSPAGWAGADEATTAHIAGGGASCRETSVPAGSAREKSGAPPAGA